MYKTTSPMLMSMTAFTIRGDQLIESIERIKKEGVVRRADLGVYLKNYGMTSERYLYDPISNSRDVSGVLVVAVDKNDSTQFKTDDIIIDVDGKHFTNAAELLLWLDENKEVGDEVKIQLYRDGSLLNITTQVRVANRFR
jgi:serine protease Do